jgi:hypothetical protein
MGNKMNYDDGDIFYTSIKNLEHVCKILPEKCIEQLSIYSYFSENVNIICRDWMFELDLSMSTNKCLEILEKAGFKTEGLSLVLSSDLTAIVMWVCSLTIKNKEFCKTFELSKEWERMGKNSPWFCIEVATWPNS